MPGLMINTRNCGGVATSKSLSIAAPVTIKTDAGFTSGNVTGGSLMKSSLIIFNVPFGSFGYIG